MLGISASRDLGMEMPKTLSHRANASHFPGLGNWARMELTDVRKH